MPVYHGIRPWDSTDCSSCLTTVRNAKFLPCSHRFCQSCVSQQVTKLAALVESRERVTITCPHCREFFHSSLKELKPRPSTALAVRSSVDDTRSTYTPRQRCSETRSSETMKKKKCDPCSSGGEYSEAGFWCQNCCEYLCFTCTQYHKAMKMSRGHIVKTTNIKDKYDTVKSKVAEVTRSKSMYNPPKTASGKSTNALYACEPCGVNKRSRDARYVCDTCKERLCEDCSQCHRSMKMSKTHKLVSLQDLLSKPESSLSLGMRCDKHKDEVLSLFCKRCKTSCCTICAVRLHNNCVPSTKPETISKQFTKLARDANKQVTKPACDADKQVSFGAKPVDTKKPSIKCTIPERDMLRAKSRLVVCSAARGEWIISLAILSTGEILAIELFSNELKLLDSTGQLISKCSFYGEPWSVATHTDKLAAVTFSDRKQIQLVNIDAGLETGKMLRTRHKSLAICFCKNVIVTSCWEGCIHAMNICGEELFSIDKNKYGEPLLVSPEYITTDKSGHTIYVSDFKRDSVTAITILPNRFESSPKFVFTHPDLKGPKGITVDKQGVLYISGMTSRNIFRVSSEGQLIQIYRRQDELDYYEDIGISANEKHLLVSAYEDNSIIKFTFR